jgi:hypothetical protein
MAIAFKTGTTDVASALMMLRKDARPKCKIMLVKVHQAVFANNQGMYKGQMMIHCTFGVLVASACDSFETPTAKEAHDSKYAEQSHQTHVRNAIRKLSKPENGNVKRRECKQTRIFKTCNSHSSRDYITSRLVRPKSQKYSMMKPRMATTNLKTS